MSDSKKIEEFNTDSLRQIAREIVVRRFSLRVHWIAYIFINLLLFVINYYIDYSYPWHYWALVGWGVAILLHSFSYLTYRKGLIATASTGLLVYHIFFYLVINALLLFINWFTNPTQTLSWFYWPLGTWGAVIVVHCIFYYSNRPRKPEDARKSWIDRQVDEELRKVQKA